MKENASLEAFKDNNLRKLDKLNIDEKYKADLIRYKPK